MITVLIVDDHELVRVGLKRLLAEVEGIEVVGEADCGEAAIKLAKELQPNVVLMDVRMPGMGGLEATKRLLRYNPDVKVIAVTACTDDPFPTRLLQAGAFGYVTKDTGIDEMIVAIRKVNAGQRYLKTEIAQQLALKGLTAKGKDSVIESLSERELQIMMLITKGETVASISEQLHLSTKTIHTYRFRLFEKLKVQNDVELTHLAIRYGLVDGSTIDAGE